MSKMFLLLVFLSWIRIARMSAYDDFSAFDDYNDEYLPTRYEESNPVTRGVVLGSNVEMLCNFDFQLDWKYWSFNGRMLYTLPCSYEIQNSYEYSDLTIRNITKECSGEYTCHIRDRNITYVVEIVQEHDFGNSKALKMTTSHSLASSYQLSFGVITAVISIIYTFFSCIY